MEHCPLTGKPCPFPKSIHITDTHNWKSVNEYHLCQECGNEVLTGKITPVAPAPVPQVVQGLLNLLSVIIKTNIPEQAIQEIPSCPRCGVTTSYIIKESRLGCPECYNHFAAELEPVFISFHSATQHVGKRPKTVNKEELLAKLELQLKQVVDQQKYEQAAEIKKKIDEIKKQ